MMTAIITDTKSVILRTFDSIIEGYHPRSTLLLEGEFLGAGYPEQCNGKNNVYHDIHIAEPNYYTSGSLGSALETHLISPLQDDLINKKNDEPDTDQKDRIPTQVPVVMRDHEIYLSDTHQDDHKSIADLKIGSPIGDTAEDEIFHHPDQRYQHDQQVKNTLIVPQQTP